MYGPHFLLRRSRANCYGRRLLECDLTRFPTQSAACVADLRDPPPSLLRSPGSIIGSIHLPVGLSSSCRSNRGIFGSTRATGVS